MENKIETQSEMLMNSVDLLMEQIYRKADFVQRWCESHRAEIYISSIVDQNQGIGGARPSVSDKFPPEKAYYVFVKAVNKPNIYLELEIGFSLYKDHGKPYVTLEHVEQSSHGSPASYGFTVYATNKQGDEVEEYDNKFWGLEDK